MQIESVKNNWEAISAYLTKPKNDRDYARLTEFCDTIVDKLGYTQDSVLEDMFETVSILISEYEKENVSDLEGNPIECLKYLMEEHGLKQKDLIEIGSPGVISEVMNGKRQLNKRQILALSERFGCSVEVFMD